MSDPTQGNSSLPAEKFYLPSVSQRQADAMQHAAHSPEYSERRSIPQEVAQGRFLATVQAGLWGKTLTSPCPKCEAGE